MKPAFGPGQLRSVLPAVFLLSLAALSGCGGGGGGGTDSGISPPPAPSLSLSPQAIKTFRFTWADVTGETEYRLLEDPNSTSGYTQIATIAANAVSHDLVVSLPKRINARYILQACNSAGCTNSNTVTVSGTLAQAAGYVKASNTEAVDFFSYSLALSADGNTLAVGAYGEASNATGIGGNQGDNSASGSGAVYLY